MKAKRIADARAHRLDLLRVGGRHLPRDVHHLAHDGVHSLAGLLEDVRVGVVRARWIGGGLVVSAHKTSCLAPAAAACLADVLTVIHSDMSRFDYLGT
eukprot:1936848-Pleurochrysis_carterae.AAC.1